MIEPEETHFLSSASPPPPSPLAPPLPPWLLAFYFLLALSLTFLLVRVTRQDDSLALLQSTLVGLSEDLRAVRRQVGEGESQRVGNESAIREELEEGLERVGGQARKNMKAVEAVVNKVKDRVNRITDQLHQLAKELQLRPTLSETMQNNAASAKIDSPSPTQITSEVSAKTTVLTAQGQNELQLKVNQLTTTLQISMGMQREQFHERKMKYFKSLLGQQQLTSEIRKNAFLQSMGNLHLPHPSAITIRQLEPILSAELTRLATKYSLPQTDPALSFCIVVPTFNNAKDFRYEYNLQSILNLNYQNYHVVIVDDASTDGTPLLLREAIGRLDRAGRVQLVERERQMTAVPNIHLAVTKYCREGEVVVLVDGDDELLGREVLRVFAAVYEQKGADVVYSNHIKMQWHLGKVGTGWSLDYTDAEKRNNLYRQVPQKISHLRSFKASLFLRIAESDLKDAKGEWLRSTYDEVICLPILEMSCGRIEYIEQYFYLYNFGTGSNDLMVDGDLQREIADYVKNRKKKYQCVDDV